MRNTRCKQLILDEHPTLCLLFVSKSDVTPTVSARQAFLCYLFSFQTKGKTKKKRRARGTTLQKKKKEKRQ